MKENAVSDAVAYEGGGVCVCVCARTESGSLRSKLSHPGVLEEIVRG